MWKAEFVGNLFLGVDPKAPISLPPALSDHIFSIENEILRFQTSTVTASHVSAFALS